jgi:hypothetical protein
MPAVFEETSSTILNMSENRFSAVVLSLEIDDPNVSLFSFLQETISAANAKMTMRNLFFMT